MVCTVVLKCVLKYEVVPIVRVLILEGPDSNGVCGLGDQQIQQTKTSFNDLREIVKLGIKTLHLNPEQNGARQKFDVHYKYENAITSFKPLNSVKQH